MNMENSMYNKKKKLLALSIFHFSLLVLLAACNSPVAFPTTSRQVAPSQKQTNIISCPFLDQTRGAEMPSLKIDLHLHSTLVYVENGNDNSAALIRYDAVTGQKTDIIRWPFGVIMSPQISTDDQWVLFITQLGNQHQFSLNLIRIDGQYLQTLYCDNSESISDPRWSPNQSIVVFDTASGVSWLSLTSGQLDLNVLSAADRFFDSSYRPRMWLDNTHVYLDDTFHADSTNADVPGDLTTLVLLDIKRGLHQQEQDLTPVFADPRNMQTANAPCSDLIMNSARTKLLLSQCQAVGYTRLHDHIYVTRTGPGSISVLPVAGGLPQQIMKFPSFPLTTLRLTNLAGTSLLLTVDDAGDSDNDHYSGVSQNGLWKVNSDGSGLKQLITDRAGEHVFLDPAGQLPWSNVSVDGSMYAAQIYQSNTFVHTIVVGSLNGGQPLILTEISHDETGVCLAIAGWTML
jgi:hypothetical protein